MITKFFKKNFYYFCTISSFIKDNKCISIEIETLISIILIYTLLTMQKVHLTINISIEAKDIYYTDILFNK